MEEIWKDIEGYEGYYQVSNLGRVKSLDRMVKHPRKGLRPIRGRILKIGINMWGYSQVVLCTKGTTKNFTVHRLVAQAFIPNPDILPQINHKDENKSNNRVENLEWCTSEYNNNYGLRLNRISDKRKNDIRLSKPVLCIELDKMFPSIKEASRWLNKKYAFADISKCCMGKKYKTVCGYHWQFIEKEAT